MAVALTFKVSGVSNSTGNVVSATALSTSGPSLIVILVGWGDNAPGPGSISTVKLGATGTENAATFRVRVSNTPTSSHGHEIWTYWSAGAISNWTVTATYPAATAPFTLLSVVEATGTDSSSAGPGTGTANSGALVTSATVSVTVNASGSVVIGGIATDFAGGTPGANTVELQDASDGNGFGYYVCNNNQATVSGNTYSFIESFTSGAHAATGLEIKPAAVAGGTTRLLASTGVGT